MQGLATIQLRELSVGYGSRCVLNHINATIAGGLTCLLGDNGVGKSTLLRTISRFQPKLSGEISINDKHLENFSQCQLAQTIGVVLTEKPDSGNLTAREIVGMGRSPYTGFWGSLDRADEAIVDEALSLTGVAALAARKFHTLSDGERQKIMIAKALAQQTPIIILDEPTSFLDFASRVSIMQMLSLLARERQKTILLSTHDIQLAINLADNLWLIEPDSIQMGSPKQLAAQGILSRFVDTDGIEFDPKSFNIIIS